jgi:hypothetical protein
MMFSLDRPDRPIRIVEPDPTRSRPPAVTCASDACFKATTDKKKYCKLHLTEDPYIAAIIAENKRHENNARRREARRKKRLAEK